VDPIRYPERLNRTRVYTAAGFYTLFTLERDQSLACTTTPFTVGAAMEVALLDQHCLDFPNLSRTEIDFARAGSDRCVRRRPGRDHSDDFAAVVHYDYFVSNDEVVVTAPLRINLDDAVG
jgi:hypothetical protein